MTPSSTATGSISRFTCSICAEPSSEICRYCTKDACVNHLCERCGFCSDCCRCDIPLTEPEPVPVVNHVPRFTIRPISENGDAWTDEQADDGDLADDDEEDELDDTEELATAAEESASVPAEPPANESTPEPGAAPEEKPPTPETH